MAQKVLSGKEKFYTYFIPKVVGLGASIVIVGALFKIMHYPGAEILLPFGLGTEAIIFALYAFAPIEPPHAEPDWDKIAQSLAGVGGGSTKDAGVAAKLAAIEANIANSISADSVTSFGTGMKSLADNVGKMTTLADASVATADYAKNVKLAATSLVEMNKSYGATMTAMTSMADASKDAKAYHAQIQGLTKTLSSLNAAYEMELQDSKKFSEALSKYYGGMSKLVENVVATSKDAEGLKTQLSGLTTNLTSLNKVYGAMLTAMKGAQA
ncbi:MAG: gliding motility protein GldL [Thermonemataceae bacterium]|nr:gliding motility protein GldL [Thermonemataceae bacterium]